MTLTTIVSARSCNAALLASLCVLAMGCASPPPPELDLRQAEIVMDPAEPSVSTDGHSGKVAAAGSGAAKGGGSGVLVGTLGCVGAGPFFPICIAGVVPVMATVGAVAWGTASAVSSDSAEVVESKREMLRSAMAATPYAARLTTHLQTASRDRFAVDLPVASPDASPRAWQIDMALTGVACEDNKPGQPFALRVEGRVRLRRAGQADVLYEKALARRSDVSLTITQWRADDDAAAKAELDQTLMRFADDLLTELSQRPHRTP